MGLCLGTEITEEKKARLHSARIDRDLYEYAKREMNVVKILLLGETDMILLCFRVACNWFLGTLRVSGTGYFPVDDMIEILSQVGVDFG